MKGLPFILYSGEYLEELIHIIKYVLKPFVEPFSAPWIRELFLLSVNEEAGPAFLEKGAISASWTRKLFLPL